MQSPGGSHDGREIDEDSENLEDFKQEILAESTSMINNSMRTLEKLLENNI
jgi:hypothetical protein